MNTQELNHSYGHSYFGSGGASGSVKYHNARPSGRGDNGFIAGISQISVVDAAKAARVFAWGEDCIDEGRSWSEAWEFAPQIGWLRADLNGSPSSLPAHGGGRRTAWLVAGTEASASALAVWHSEREAARLAAWVAV
jgi:hypothetical protein